MRELRQKDFKRHAQVTWLVNFTGTDSKAGPAAGGTSNSARAYERLWTLRPPSLDKAVDSDLQAFKSLWTVTPLSL